MSDIDPSTRLERALDRGLSTAFGDSEGGRPRPASPADEREISSPPRMLGRFRVAEVIGRGGIGHVFRVVDEELGRELAIKVLKPSLRDDAEARSRFEEEARICGGLQHPSIVPIHEKGHLADGRPWFTMKVVEGKTLFRLLAEREGVHADERRWLEIFQKVSETLAFAHARDIVHGDLKPHNIMVGAFGEVQVMDWGFARTASQERESAKARVIGTPSYMSPEQASGRHDEIDARTDVFGLGALLCEILTGAPPNLGESRSEVLLRASKGAAEDVRARVTACGVDEDLASIVDACLATDRSHRYEHAGVVADRLSSYLAALDRRARQAELEAAKAAARVDEERRARRLAVSLAATIVVALLVSTVGYLWFDARRRDRQQVTQRAITDAMERAEMLGSRSAKAPGVDVDGWRLAVSAARDAKALIDSLAVGAALESEVDQLVAHLVREKDEAQTEFELATRLMDIRPERPDDRPPERCESDFAEAFAGIGLNVDEISPNELSEQVGRRRIAPALIASLDEWANIRRRLRPDEPAYWMPLTEAARLADPDPWRDRFRDAWARRDLDALRQMADSAEVYEESAETLNLLARFLHQCDDPQTAARVYEGALERHPEAFGLSHDLAHILARFPDPPLDEIVRLWSMAVTAKPGDAHARIGLAVAFSERGDHERAMTILDQVIRLEPDHPHLYCTSGRMRLRAGHVEAAVSDFVRAAAGSPDAHLNVGFGQDLRRKGYPQHARSWYQRVIAAKPDDAEAHCSLGLLLLSLGEFEEAYERLREGHELGFRLGVEWRKPSEEWLRRAERVVELEALLDRIGAGAPPPTDGKTSVELANMAISRGMHLTAARVLAVAIDAGHDSVCRHCAARCAVQAGGGVGEDASQLEEATRIEWTRRARRWLADELSSLRAAEAAVIVDTLEGWREDPAFERVRSPGLDLLPPEERVEWEALWERVEVQLLEAPKN